ncbi:MAG: U32 family peptidase [Paludibacteraceae bacterium]|nr:U32 family peptidase [Paludibacteraceae bacterium]
MLELLSPARDCQVGKIAIDSGADAVYIGAPQFSARSAAGNSIDDIKQLCQYAHFFGAKVLVALNTILSDKELIQARDIVYRLYDAGADALIVQDMGLLTLDLPPIRLHASTQCDNRTPQKVKMLEDAGFSRVVLARELSVQQIREIREQTKVELEAFVHGALCVSYSGQCYLSQAVMGRSANRGNCAQMCRHSYDLLDEKGNVLLRDKHLLSLQDMDRSNYVRQLYDAGVSTLKIEGRLKEADYVKNITAYYRTLIDGLGIERTSWGRTELKFTPNPQKTFHRGSTDYFADGERGTNMANFDTPKSTGEFVGTVRSARRDTIEISSDMQLNNGDGFVVGGVGFRASEVFKSSRHDGVQCIVVQSAPSVKAGEKVFRNYDIAFQRLLADPMSAVRTLPVDLMLYRTNEELVLKAFLPDSGANAETRIALTQQSAQNKQRMISLLREQLQKTGGSCFHASTIDIVPDELPFMRVSEINSMRRQVLELLAVNHARQINQRKILAVRLNNASADKSGLDIRTLYDDYRLNVHNQAARRWYLEHGLVVKQPAFEDTPQQGVELMRCKYCLRHELGWCKKNKAERLFIRTAGNTFALLFDCKKCEMIIKQS